MEIKTSNSSSWTFFLSGLVAITYGLFAILLPQDIIETVMLITGITIIVVGVICFLIALSRHKKSLPWGMLLTEAIVLIILGIVSAIWAKETIIVLTFIIGLWSVLMGAFMLLVVLGKKSLTNKGFYILCAILSIGFGILLIVNPFKSTEWAEKFVQITGIIALIFGIIMAMFGFAIRRQDKVVKVEIVETKEENSFEQQKVSDEENIPE